MSQRDTKDGHRAHRPWPCILLTGLAVAFALTPGFTCQLSNRDPETVGDVFDNLGDDVTDAWDDLGDVLFD